MADDRVHRDLRVTTPLMEGADVKTLQRELNKASKRFSRVLDFRLDDDGLFGNDTLMASIKAAHALGIIRSRMTEMQRGKVVVVSVQKVLRSPSRRTEGQKRRGERRRARLREQLERKGDLGSVRVTVTAGAPHWGGGNDILRQFAEPFMVKRGLPKGSGKRTPAENQAAGGSQFSDHLTTRTTAAARDFPTLFGEDDARALAHAMGFMAWKPNSHDKFQLALGGRTFSVQVLWGPLIDHDDHVHVGIVRV